MQPVLACEGLKRTFATAGGGLEVLAGVDMVVHAGELAVVLGPSGSGKSTLLHLLAGLDRPDSGEVLWSGQPLSNKSTSELARLRSRRVGLVFQQHYLLEELSALDNVSLPMRIVGDVDEARAVALLTEVGLAERADHLPSKLSGGERQRAAVARALSLDPPAVIADEPTGSLDHARAVEVFRLLGALAVEAGKAVVVVTHDETLLEEAPPGATKVYRLVQGRLERVP